MGVIEQKTVEDTKLQQSFNRNLSEIQSLTYHFNRRDEELENLRKVTKEEIVEAFSTGLVNNQRVLISAAEGNEANAPQGDCGECEEENLTPGEAFNDCTVITDISQFRKSHCFIPSDLPTKVNIAK